MLNLTTSIDEIDALIKNMEYLAPQHNERIRIGKLDELKSLMENKPLLELIQDISGKDWQDDTQRIIKKIENKYKIQQFTDIYINSLRYLLIYKAFNDVTSSCQLELTREFGQWVFNARYQGENHVVRWFDIKVNRYFAKTDLPKKFLNLMGNNPTYPVNKEWVLKNQHFFFNSSIFNDYNVLFAEFLQKLEKEELTPELEMANNIPQDDEQELGENTTTQTSTVLASVSVTHEHKPSAIAQVQNDFKKKMVQIGVDIAGDPIMKEVDDSLEEAIVAVVEKPAETIKIDVEPIEKSPILLKDEVITPVEKVSVEKLDTLSAELEREPLPWEDDLRVTVPKVETIIQKVELPEPAPAPEKIEIVAATKPSYAKPGSGIKTFSKPGSQLILADDDDGYDAIKEDHTPNVSETELDKSWINDNEAESSTPDVSEVELKPNVQQTTSPTAVYAKPGSIPQKFVKPGSQIVYNDDLFDENVAVEDNGNGNASNELKEAEIAINVDFDDILEEKNRMNQLTEEVVEEPIVITERLFENGMTNNADKELEMQKQKDEEIKKLHEIIKLREIEDKERLERNGLAKNKAFMSLRKKPDETEKTK